MYTFMSATGNRRGGGVQMSYASFLSSGVAATQVLKKSILKKKASASPPKACQKRWFEAWNDRHVTLRGNFIIVGRVNHEAQSKVHMISAVSDDSDQCFSFSVTCTHGKLYFRAKTLEEKDSWVQTIQDVLVHADSLPHMEDHKSMSASSNTLRPRIISGSGSETSFSGSVSRASSAGAEDYALLEKNPKSEIAPPGPAVHIHDAVETGMNAQATQSATRSVGVFWDTTTVTMPTLMEQEAATRKVQEFAEQHGNTKVFKVYSDEEKGKSVRKRMDKDMLIWLWDEAKKTIGQSVVILISDRAFLDTLKEFATRGTTVIVVNSSVSKTVAVSATASVEYRRSSRTLWETGPVHATIQEDDAASSTPSEQDSVSNQSDADSLSSCSGSACETRAASPEAACKVEAPVQMLEVVKKRPALATSLLVLANVMLAVLLIWVS